MESIYGGPSLDAAIRLIVVRNFRLDCDGLVQLLHAKADFQIVWSGVMIDEAPAVCEQSQVDVAVLDGLVRGSWIADQAMEMLDAKHVRGVLLLDDEPVQGRHLICSAKPGLAYFSRRATATQVCDAIRLLAAGQEVIDPNLRSWQVHSPHVNGTGSSVRSEISSLTPREAEVMRLIALGNTVKDCARILKLAQSTVDNHKSRLMKKLDVHKASDLTRLAIREGLVTV